MTPFFLPWHGVSVEPVMIVMIVGAYSFEHGWFFFPIALAKLDLELACFPAAAWRLEHFDGNRFSRYGLEQCLVVGRGTFAVGIIGHGWTLGTPAADAFVDRIDECDLVAGARAVRRADDFPHQFHEFVDVALTVGNEVLTEFQSTAAGATTLVHQFDKRSVIERRLLLRKKVGKELTNGTGIRGA